MGARFYERDQQYRFESGDGLDEAITDKNFWFWKNREKPQYDMAQMLDPRDGLNWYWHRFDVGDETIDQLEKIALAAGRFVLGSEPEEGVVQVFENKHQITDEELNQLLDGSDG